jgi:hypothetical protein
MIENEAMILGFKSRTELIGREDGASFKHYGMRRRKGNGVWLIQK